MTAGQSAAGRDEPIRIAERNNPTHQGATMTAPVDPMEGAIEGLMHVMNILDATFPNSNIRTQTSLALNEAYRNGLKAGRAENGVESPSEVESSPEESPSPQPTKLPHGPLIPVGLIADQYHTMDVNQAIRALTNVGTVTISLLHDQEHRGQNFARLNNTGHDIAAGPAWSFTDVLNELYCRWQWAQGWRWDRIYGAGGGNYHWGWVERSESKFRTSGDPS